VPESVKAVIPGDRRKRYAISMQRDLGFTIFLSLTACAARIADLAIPSTRTIAQIESGHQLLADLTVVGAYADPDELNAESRVRVRNATCRATDRAAANCKYEASRCLANETDIDGDGWCARTSKFLKVDGQPGLGEVVVNGWALDR
jgi:hypothetical protein